MAILQTVDIRDNHRITIDVPREIPTGKTLIVFKPIAEASPCMTAQEAKDLGLGLSTGPRIDPVEAIEQCSGLFKRLDISLSSDDFLVMRRQDKELEERLDAFHEEERRPGK